MGGCGREIKVGEQAVCEKGFLDGKPTSCYTCLKCIEKWLEESGQVDNNDKGEFAKVLTLLPGKVKLSTKILEWDGSVIRAEGNQLMFWGLSNEPVAITPNENTYVQIVDNTIVTDDTEFKDE